MEKDSALYQLIDTRMNGVMNGIVSDDGKYQGILRKPDIYSGELGRMDLSKEIRMLVDQYVSEQNALGSRHGMLAYLPFVYHFPSNPCGERKRNPLVPLFRIGFQQPQPSFSSTMVKMPGR